jgi:hypothetical protein
VVNAGFDRARLLDLTPHGYDASVQLFMHGTRDVDVYPHQPDAFIPYILPGPLDAWAGNTAHTLRLRLGALPRPAMLRLHAIETHDARPPHLTLRLNQTLIGTVDTRPGTGKPPPHQTHGVRSQYAIGVPASATGPSVLAITNDGGSWVMWERIELRETRSSFAWDHFGITGRPPLSVLGFLTASLGAALLARVVAGIRGRGAKVRLAAAAGVLALVGVATVLETPGGIIPSALPRWSWLLVPWLIMAASSQVLARAIRAAGRSVRWAWPPRCAWRADQRRGHDRRRALALAGALALAAFLIQAQYVKLFAVDIPFWDEWEHLPRLVAYKAGTLTWPDLYAQHNEHRILVPRLLVLASFAVLGEWSPRAGMLLSAALVGATAFIWTHALHRLRVRMPVALVSTAILVSPLQWENITSSFQSSVYLSMLASLLGVSLVALGRSPGWGRVATAIAACAVASFSFAAGLASWAAVGLCLGLRMAFVERRRWSDWSKVATYGLAGGLGVVAFFRGFQSDRVAPLQMSAEVTRWMLAALAFPFVEATTLPLLALLAVVVLQWAPIVGLGVLYVRRRHEPGTVEKLGLLVGMASLVLISAGAIGIGRGAFPIVSPRYGTIFLWTSLLGVLAVAELADAAPPWRLRPRARAAVTLALGLLGAGLLSPYVVGLGPALDWLHRDTINRDAMRHTLIRFLDSAATARRLGEPLPYPSREALEAWLSQPATLAVVPMELRLVRGPGWRVREDGRGRDEPGDRWIQRPRVESVSIRVDRPVLAIPVAGYPGAPGNWLAVEPVANPEARLVYDGPDPGPDWRTWWVHVGGLRGQEIRLVGVVGNDSGEGWLAFKVPGQTHRLMGGLADFPSTSTLVVAALVIGLLCLVLVPVADPAAKTYRDDGVPEPSG